MQRRDGEKKGGTGVGLRGTCAESKDATRLALLIGNICITVSEALALNQRMQQGYRFVVKEDFLSQRHLR